MAVRKSTFLARPDWTRASWELEEKTIEHQWMDVMPGVAGLLEKYDLIEKLTNAEACWRRPNGSRGVGWFVPT